MKHQTAPTPGASRAESTGEETPKVLTVGEPVDPGSDSPAPVAPYLGFLAFHEVSAAALALHQPDVVLSPLVSASFDCFDLADVLVAAGFHGRYRAAVTHLPNPMLVKREMAARWPSLDFELLILGEVGGAAARIVS